MKLTFSWSGTAVKLAGSVKKVGLANSNVKTTYNFVLMLFEVPQKYLDLQNNFHIRLSDQLSFSVECQPSGQRAYFLKIVRRS